MMSLDDLLPTLKKTIKDIELLNNSAEFISGENAAVQYVKNNDLKYCEDEIKKAFKSGFIFCLRQIKLGKFDDIHYTGEKPMNKFYVIFKDQKKGVYYMESGTKDELKKICELNKNDKQMCEPCTEIEAKKKMNQLEKSAKKSKSNDFNFISIDVLPPKKNNVLYLVAIITKSGKKKVATALCYYEKKQDKFYWEIQHTECDISGGKIIAYAPMPKFPKEFTD